MRKYGSKYDDQLAGSRKRGIDWQFTYEEWEQWWGDDIHKRGPRADQLVMARYGDTGPYHPDNVYKSTMSENCKFQQQRRKEKYGRYNLINVEYK